MIDHDQLFKQLLETFFLAFLDLFFPQVLAFAQPDSIPEFLPQDLFDPATGQNKRVTDLVVKMPFRNEKGFFLVHLETQSYTQEQFPERMFTYFARLQQKYGLPIYSIVLFSHDSPKRLQPDRYTVAFPDRKVLQFEYSVVQLNRLAWREFVNRPNPVASALMAKMGMKRSERVKVKWECLRMLASLKLDPAKTRLIGRFVETYLRLTAREQAEFERLLEQLAPSEKEATMEVLTYWEQKGLEKGLEEGLQKGLQMGKQEGLQMGKQVGKQEGLQVGKQEMALRQLRRRFGEDAEPFAKRLATLTPAQLDDLAEALLDFTALTDLEAWLITHTA